MISIRAYVFHRPFPTRNRPPPSPSDPSSVEASKDDPTSQKFLKDEIGVTERTSRLADFIGKSADYDALFYVGGGWEEGSEGESEVGSDWTGLD